MDRYRFFLPDLAPGLCPLPEDQVHHARHVLRLEDGTPILVFDGRGGWGEATLRVTGKRTLAAEVKSVQHDPSAAIRLTLATAVPKADRAEWLLEQASQLNAAAVQWLDCDRGVVKPKESGGKLEKWRRLAIESAKQCGRTHVLEVLPMATLDAVLTPAIARGDVLLWGEPRAGRSAGEVLHELTPRWQAATPETPLRITALIGPEGGWSPAELARLEATAAAIRLILTPTILRIETAAAALAAVIGTHRASAAIGNRQ